MKKIYILVVCWFAMINTLQAQGTDNSRDLRSKLKEYFNNYTSATAETPRSGLKSLSVDNDKKLLTIEATETFAYQPFRPEMVEQIYRDIHRLLPDSLHSYELNILSEGRLIDELIPNIYRKKMDKARLSLNIDYTGAPWVQNISRPFEIPRGLADRHIAVWQSHGRYFKSERDEWLWQRPRLFCTAEDLFTQSIVVPFVIPMLENAGAVVYTPRERDPQRNEVIVDNDSNTTNSYQEINSSTWTWNTVSVPGFAHIKEVYQDGENPFTDGTSRYINTNKPTTSTYNTTYTKKKKKKRELITVSTKLAQAIWQPNIPEEGNYAVYVSYTTLPNSIDDAHYTVYHQGVATDFTVNQQMGGNTWVYLGTFRFDKGNSEFNRVVLTNQSQGNGVVSADAVRFGGGMGNIQRGSSVSGLPRYLEGARYWTQWAGMPYELYGGRNGSNDYADDINSRSLTVNYLSGGSIYNPKEEGLKVPFELSVAMHSDAGTSNNNSFIGTLGIYTTDYNEGQLNDGLDRIASRDLSDIILTQIQGDVSTSFNTKWTRRNMWDRNYSETRLPAVPSTIVEMLSHQNFTDMKLGHDPRYKFVLARAIYKGVLRFIATQHDKEYVVQPLPISHFAIRMGRKKNSLTLTWKGENDPLEPTARPQGYIVYTRIGQGAFDNGVYVDEPIYITSIDPNVIYSFKITAVNKGGESFPSQILSACKADEERGKVLIIDGFDRVSGPAIVDTPENAGFDIEKDPGVGYMYTNSFCGKQRNFDRYKGNNNLGASGSELEGQLIAGNTFDYTILHGKAILAAGRHSFVSCSKEAVEDGIISLEDFSAIDYLLGLEKANEGYQSYYKTFSNTMQRKITSYCHSGGNLMVSGAYIGSDMNNNQSNINFTKNVLKYTSQGSLDDTNSGDINGLNRTISILRIPNEKFYPVTSPDVLKPEGSAIPVFAYSPSKLCAGIAYKGRYNTFIMAFPFESIQSEKDRAVVMASILNFFQK